MDGALRSDSVECDQGAVPHGGRPEFWSSTAETTIRIASKWTMMQNQNMRTSVTLDDDIHELASIYANARGITLGAAIGELIREGRNPAASRSSEIEMGRHGLPVFRSRGRVLTSEMVKAAQEDDPE